MMIKFGILLAGCAVLSFAAERNVTLDGDQWKWVIENFSGFNYWHRNERWTITTNHSSTIRLSCPEIRLPGRTHGICQKGKLVFNDGVKNTTYCGSSENVLFDSNSSKLVVDFVLPRQDTGGRFYCKGKSVEQAHQ